MISKVHPDAIHIDRLSEYEQPNSKDNFIKCANLYIDPDPDPDSKLVFMELSILVGYQTHNYIAYYDHKKHSLSYEYIMIGNIYEPHNDYVKTSNEGRYIVYANDAINNFFKRL